MNKKEIYTLHRLMVTTANVLIDVQADIPEDLYNVIYDAILIVNQDLRDLDESDPILEKVFQDKEEQTTHVYEYNEDWREGYEESE